MDWPVQARNLLRSLCSPSLTALPCASLLSAPSTEEPDVFVWVAGRGIYLPQGQQMLICIYRSCYSQLLFSLTHVGYWCPLCCRPPKEALKGAALLDVEGETGNICSSPWHRWSSRRTAISSLEAWAMCSFYSSCPTTQPPKDLARWSLFHPPETQVFAASPLPPNRATAIWSFCTRHVTILPYFILPTRLLVWVLAHQTSEKVNTQL